MTKIWTRQEFDAEPARTMDAARKEPQIVADTDGRYVISFQRGGRRSASEWVLSDGVLEEDDRL